MPSARTTPPARLAWKICALGALLYLIGFYHRVAPAVLTEQLMADFNLGAAALGNLSAVYFYAYAVMQIPAGVLADRLGPRRLLAAGALLAAGGSFFFALAASFLLVSAARLLVGAGVAVAFVATLKLASRWFRPQQFALVSGAVLFCGVCGGIFAGAPLHYLVASFGWRPVMLLGGCATLALAGLIWRWVRDDPAAYGYLSYAPPQHGGHAPLLRSLAQVLAYRNSWLLMLVPVGISGSVLAFAGLWGVPYLRQVHGLDTAEAALCTSLLLLAWALGGPLLGALSERLGKRKPLYLATTMLGLAGWSAAIYLPLALPLLLAVLVVTSFACGNLIIGFAFARESVPPQLMGTASGVCNVGPLLGGVVLQPAIGWLLDQRWQGVSLAGGRIYDAAAYQAGFSLIIGGIVVSFLLLLLTRETHCRQTP